MSVQISYYGKISDTVDWNKHWRKPGFLQNQECLSHMFLLSGHSQQTSLQIRNEKNKIKQLSWDHMTSNNQIHKPASACKTVIMWPLIQNDWIKKCLQTCHSLDSPWLSSLMFIFQTSHQVKTLVKIQFKFFFLKSHSLGTAGIQIAKSH